MNIFIRLYIGEEDNVFVDFFVDYFIYIFFTDFGTFFIFLISTYLPFHKIWIYRSEL